jgi:hypothetical protein
MMEPTKATKAFFISEFADRSRFVYQTLVDVIEASSNALGRQVDIIRLDQQSPPDLIGAIQDGLNSSTFAVCDITPPDSSAQSEWNANVFFELGMAHQLRLPTFLICDDRRQPGKLGPRLPFDISTKSVHFYDFTPLGLNALKQVFQTWLLDGFHSEFGWISAYEQSQDFVHAARDVKHALLEWDGVWAVGFRQLIARMVTPLQDELTQMTQFMRSTSTSPYKFEPAAPTEAIEHLFIAMMKSLGRDDTYDTLSTIPFWQSFRDNGRRFREVCAESCKRGVKVRRLLVIPEQLDSVESRVVLGHIQLCAASAKAYELRIEQVPRERALFDEGHVGICDHKEWGVATAFEPDYSGTNPPRVVAIRLRNDATDAKREFEERWARVPQRPAEELRRMIRH